MRSFLLLVNCFLQLVAFGQSSDPGLVMGNVLDENNKPLELATVQLLNINDSQQRRSVVTDRNGAFLISRVPFGYYSLKISYVGFQTLTLDSIHFRAERYDFNLNDLALRMVAPDSGSMEQVIIYFEKPLIQSKDGNITFNAGESALSAGSTAGELLTNVPLVTKDPDGKILVRGKEPRILIDDKPVELNLQQLEDLLESMPGSSIEKIEVMTNPPPQYATEEGGVINIVTKKGSVGKSGRLSVYAGTRGEAGLNGSFNYRKKGLSLNINTGMGSNRFDGHGYSRRQNLFADSTNYFNTANRNTNRNLRPNFRTHVNYDINKFNSINLVVQYNRNNYDNSSFTENTNLNSRKEIYRLSERTLKNEGQSENSSLNLSYTLKTKRAGETLKLYSNLNLSTGESNRDFYQQYFYADHSANGKDSTQHLATSRRTKGYNLRLSYDRPLANEKTFLSAGSFYSVSGSDVSSDASYLRKGDGMWIPLAALENHFRFRQEVNTYRASVKQLFGSNWSSTGGLSAEYTHFSFDLYKAGEQRANTYWSYLPFVRVHKNWEEKLSLGLSYRKTIRRPGSNELNPTVDSADAYTIRTGNTSLRPSIAHNFDLVAGKTKNSFYANVGLGYNIVDDVFAQIRTSLSDTTTRITWENISGRKEYEISTWSGYTLNRHTRLSFSASYSYNTYSEFDKRVRNYRNGASFTSNLNGNYLWKDLYNATGSFTYNRFANPQGRVKSSLSMNIGLQAKMLQKKLIATLNIIDPFAQQQNRRFTYTDKFTLENFNTTQTRSFRLTIGYNFSGSRKKTSAASKTLQKGRQKINP